MLSYDAAGFQHHSTTRLWISNKQIYGEADNPEEKCMLKVFWGPLFSQSPHFILLIAFPCMWTLLSGYVHLVQLLLHHPRIPSNFHLATAWTQAFLHHLPQTVISSQAQTNLYDSPTEAKFVPSRYHNQRHITSLCLCLKATNVNQS